MIQKTIKQKVISCYPHIKAKSIAKVIGCSHNYVYEVLREAGLKVPNYQIVAKKIPRYNKWTNI